MQNKSNHYCIIMAGGYSNQFWPISRESKPKQFLEFPESDISLLQVTYNRCLNVVPKENILIITLEKYKDLVNEQLPTISEENILLEPYGRHTAPCIAFATYTLLKRNPNAVMVVTPSDLIINNEDKFSEILQTSLEYAENENILITLGIKPDRPNPNFGYIQIAGGNSPEMKNKLIKVKTFTEKPDIEIAKAFCKSGEFFWNSGIFVWKASVIHEEMQKYTPQITGLFKGWQNALGSTSEKAFLLRAYSDCTKLSIDYGVMEKTSRAWLYPVNFGWSDIDNWDSLYENYKGKDDNENISNARHIHFKDNKRSIIISENKDKLLAIKGLEDFIVVDTEDVLLICPRDDKRYRKFIAGLNMPDFEDYR